VGVCAIPMAIWHICNEFIFKIMFPNFLAGYFFGYPLDSYVVLSSAGGAAPGHKYWV
jgi:hypothetical protein